METAGSITTESDARAYIAERFEGAIVERLERFVRLLREENARQNLVSAASLDHVWQRHIGDSIQLLHFVPRETLSSPWLDIGSGAGLPGMVLAIARPQDAFVLAEPRARRAEFLRRCADALGLVKCEIAAKRVENLEPFAASVVTARAVASLTELARISAPFVTNRTIIIFPKGRAAVREHADLTQSVRKMFHVEHSLTDLDAGIVVRKPDYGKDNGHADDRDS